VTSKKEEVGREAMKIEIVNPIESRTDNHGAKHLTTVLSFPSSYWRKGQFGMRRFEFQKSLMKRHKDGHTYFLTGFIPRVRKQFPSAQIETCFDNQVWGKAEPTLPNITFRPDQKQLIAQALKAGRGIIQSPTGSGKTILQLGILSTMPKDFCALILTHTKDLVAQTVDELRKFGFSSKTQMLMEGNRPKLVKPIVVSTIQTFVGYSVDDYSTHFDLVIVDEAHRVSSMVSNYHQVLSTLLAPFRFGFTATIPEEKEAQMTAEGLLGPIVAKLTINEASILGVIARPKLRLIKLPENYSIRQTCKSYDEVVRHGIVGSLTRTEKICNIVENGVKHGKVTLVMVNQIEHGNKIQAELKARGLDIPFVQGITDGLERVRVKNALIAKKLLAAICTGVWSEGINIVSINTIILAHLGKSELKTLQNIGRGLRRSDEKDTVSIVDFYDPSHVHLVRHFGERLCLYFDMHWV
jgi:superfamily II DNA or RNA helicase